MCARTGEIGRVEVTKIENKGQPEPAHQSRSSSGSAAIMPMTYAHPESLVSTEWLAQHLDAPDLRVVDASWYLPAQGSNAAPNTSSGHIPGAVFFDIDEIADTESDLPHMLPSRRSSRACASWGSATATASSSTTSSAS